MDTFDAFQAQGRARAPRSLRVTFAYQGNAIRVIDSRPVEMIAPPAITAPPSAGQTGYWVQLTDPSARVIWHRPLSNPIAVDVEVFGNDRGQTVARVPVQRVEGQFSVIVPDVPDAAMLSLHGPPDARMADAPARVLVTLPIDALRKFVPPAGAPPGGTAGPRGN